MLVKAERSQHYVLLRAFQSQITAAKKEQFHARKGKKDENGTSNMLFNFKFSLKKQPPKRPKSFC